MYFKDYLNNNILTSDSLKLLEVVMLDENILNEEKFNTKQALKQIGLSAHKGGPGLIEIIYKAGKQIGKILYYAILAFKQNTPESKEKLKKTINNSKISKGQMLDFILKLDALTLHIITGPLHMIDSITGWHIMANIKETTKNTIDRIKNAINNLKIAATKSMGIVKTKLLKWIDDLEILLKTEMDKI